jgi:hypothetical protein
MNDVRRVIYGTLVGFLAVVLAWVGFIYLNACGFTVTCRRAAPLVVRTPIPTLIPVKQGSSPMESSSAEFNQCEIAAADLVGAWVSAGSSPTGVFPFTDGNGQSCEGSYSVDIVPLFVENNLWSSRAIGCVSCHNSDLSARSGGLDLTSYDAMRLGAGRVDANAKGSDIFGGGNWKASSLYNVLVNQGLVAAGHSAETPAKTVILYAGNVVGPPATPTP